MESIYKGFYTKVQEERGRQDGKWGVQRHDFRIWMNILGEEFGEACKEANEYHFEGNNDSLENLKEELIQMSAVCKAIYEHIEELSKPTLN